MTDVRAAPHSKLEDLLGLLTGVYIASLGIYVVESSGTVTGGTAGLALLISYAFDWQLGIVFVAVAVPFYVLAWLKLGPVFTLKSLVCVALAALLVELHDDVLELGSIDRTYGAIGGNLLAGVGLLILIRHGASLGGVNVVALLAQENLGWRMGYVQMVIDVGIVTGSLFVADAETFALSALGAVVLNIVLAFNHGRGRYMGR